MNWSDERYVKLYTRDTLTWLSLGFEARALLALMLRKVNGAGVIETGTMETARAVALQIVAPVDVVRTGLAQLLELEVAELVPNGVALTNFIEAQEATKTESLKKKDQRQRDLDQRRQSQLIETLGAVVPARPGLSPVVPLQPSPAQLTTSPAQPSSPPAQKDSGRSKKPKAQGDLLPPPPKPPREPSRAEVMYARFQFERTEHLRDLGQDPVPPDSAVSSVVINQAFRRWFDLWADLPPLKPEQLEALEITTTAEWRCLRLFELYFEQTKPGEYTEWDSAKKLDTGVPQPWPFRSLASDKWWPQLVAAEWPDEIKAGAA